MLRLDGHNVLRCGERRARGPGLPCDTPVARPSGAELVVRCRNCHVDHIFTAVGGRIAWAEDRPRSGRPDPDAVPVA